MLRQTRWKVKMFQAGACINCGKPRGKSPYKRTCVVCAVKQRVKFGKRFGMKPWVPGSQGRPPLVKLKVNQAKVEGEKKNA